MELNLRWIMATMRSISLGEMGRVRDCSLSRFITWLVNSLQAWKEKEKNDTEEISAIVERWGEGHVLLNSAVLINSTLCQ